MSSTATAVRSLLVVVAAVVLARAQSAPPSVPAGVEHVAAVSFVQRAGQDLLLDLARPKDVARDLPLIVCVHGGGWRGGNRQLLLPVIFDLAQHGFVAVTVDYRLTTTSKFPAQIDDVRAALRFLHANAARYHIDASRVGAIGDSAGGHLVLLLALCDADDIAGGGLGDEASATRVQAVASMYGPTDLKLLHEHAPAPREMQVSSVRFLLEQLLGGAPDIASERYARASPINYA